MSTVTLPNAEKGRKAVGGSKPTPGVYFARIVEAGKSRKGDRYLIKWEVVLGEQRGCQLTDGYGLDSTMGVGILIQRIERLGVAVSKKGAFDEDELVNRIAEINVVEKDGYLNVKGLAPVSQDVLDRVKTADESEAAGTGDASDDEDVPF